MAEASKYSNGYCLATGDILLTKQSEGFTTETATQGGEETNGEYFSLWNATIPQLRGFEFGQQGYYTPLSVGDNA